MRIGLFGGSFNPVHKGHLKLASAARRELKLSCVYLLLSRSPFKTHEKQAAAALRANHLRKALKGKRGFHVSTWELERQGPSYTANTVRYFKKKFPKDQLFFIMGSDAVKTFKKWKTPRAIIKNAQLVVGKRPGFTTALPKNLFGQKILYLKSSFPRVSSTGIRKQHADR